MAFRTEIVFDRSRHEAYEKCPRLRFLAYEVPVDIPLDLAQYAPIYGLQRAQRAVPLLSGGSVHKLIEHFLNGWGEDAAVLNALEAYDAEVAACGIEADELAPEPTWVIKVQRALIEALGRGWIRYVWPGVEQEFDIITIEQEMRVTIAGVTLLARADLIMQRKSDQRLFVRNFKTINEASAKKRAAFRYDTQSISEVLAASAHIGQEVDGVIYDLLVKGPRKAQYPPKSGVWHNVSPLIWCYVKEGQSGVTDDEIATRWEWNCTAPHKMANHHQCPGGREHKLGKGWNRKLVTDVFPEGIVQWFEYLEHFDPELLREQFITLEPIMRSPYDVEVWKRSVLGEETMIATKAQMVRDVMGEQGLQSVLPILDQAFPKHTAHGNCLWPSNCVMHDICWGTAAADPLENGYQPRKPNHPVKPPQCSTCAGTRIVTVHSGMGEHGDTEPSPCPNCAVSSQAPAPQQFTRRL